MSEITEAIELGTSFGNTMQKLEAGGLTMFALGKLDKIVPGLRADIDTIYQYMNNSFVVNEVDLSDASIASTEPTVEPTDVPTVEEEEKPKCKLQRPEKAHLSNDEVDPIIDYICETCDGKPIATLIDGIAEKFNVSKNISEKILRQKTYKNRSQNKFKVSYNKIVVLKQMTYVNHFKNSNEDIALIKDLIRSTKGDILQVIKPDMSAQDIVYIAFTRYAMYKTNEYPDIGNAVKEILIMNIHRNHKNENIEFIQSALLKKYGVTADATLISAVRNGRVYKDLFDRMEALNG